MGLESVLEEVRAQGQRERERILAEADAEAKKIASAAEAEARKARAAIASRTQTQRADRRREALAAAEFQARRGYLQVQREMTQRFRQQVAGALASLEASRRSRIVAASLEKAAHELPEGKVFAAAADVEQASAGAYQQGGPLDGSSGGFRVESKDGQVVLDFRFETLLDDAWKRILAATGDLFEVE